MTMKCGVTGWMLCVGCGWATNLINGRCGYCDEIKTLRAQMLDTLMAQGCDNLRIESDGSVRIMESFDDALRRYQWHQLRPKLGGDSPIDDAAESTLRLA